MAKIIVVVQTHFKDGTYRKNTVKIDIPQNAAKLIKEYWKERGICNCTSAKSNYSVTGQEKCEYVERDEILIGGLDNLCKLEQTNDEE